MPTELEELRERYETKLQAYVAASRKVEAALGTVGPLGSAPIPTVSAAWIDAVKEEKRIEPEYIAARDAYYAAAQKQG